MDPILPAIAVVRPRVSSTLSSDVRLLEDVVAEIAEEFPHTILRLVGPAGSGKSTALRHLAAVFDGDDRFAFSDLPATDEIPAPADGKFLVTTAYVDGSRVVELKLAPWRTDEFVEYLLAKHRTACGSVMARLGAAARRPWLPQLATIFLERFVASETAADPATELCGHVRERVPESNPWKAVCRYCLRSVTRPSDEAFVDGFWQLTELGCPAEIKMLVAHEIVQTPLAAEALVSEVVANRVDLLKRRLPFDFVEAAGRVFGANPLAMRLLRKINLNQKQQAAHAMATSILRVADPTWRPEPRKTPPWHLRGAYFREVAWRRLDFANADITQVDFSGSGLQEAWFDQANAFEVRFDDAILNRASLKKMVAIAGSFLGASLREAKLDEANLSRANFTDANLSGASLREAKLNEANLSSCCLKGADLTKAKLLSADVSFASFIGASLIEANLTSVDFRTAQLAGVQLDRANLTDAQLEDVYLPQVSLCEARLENAHLSGSMMPGANLRGANFSGAYLAEIEWEDADLHGANLEGATFHMGSSRSGLVGSPIACEGSKTGFYTDDYEDMHFKRAEEVRKANLRGADLRGANIEGVDFYLVDLRDARLDPEQLEHVRKCRAILEDLVS